MATTNTPRDQYLYWNDLYTYAVRMAWETNACATSSEAQEHIEALETAGEAARGMRAARRAMRGLTTRGAQA